jgi:hypothetical protein
VFPWWQNKKVEVYMLYNLSAEDRKCMESDIRERLEHAVGREYANRILNYETDGGPRTVMDDIIDDVCLSSDYEKYEGYTCADLQFAIGRAICKCIGTDY